MSKNKAEVDCTVRCRSRKHGQIITGAITKRSISDKALASFIKGTCANFVKAFDSEGRTALHMAASRGRVNLMEWLVRHSSEAFVNARDRESGYTPLHRSIFYGQINCAVSLMKIGVNTDILDKDDYKALEHALLDRGYMQSAGGEAPCDAYVWGANHNYTLATGSNQPRNTPEPLATFSRANLSVKQVCLGKFHSVWLCAEGGVSVSGQAARAGAPPHTALRPLPLHLSERVLAVALTLDSTIMLLESGTVVQYTINNTETSQSNVKNVSSVRLGSVKPLVKLSKPLGVVAGRSHGAVWNKHAVYTWGHNVGQLGHSQEDKVVATPKKVAISLNSKEEVGFELVDAGEAATVVTTTRGDVYLLHNYITKKIAIKQINLRQVCVECKVSEQGVYSRVTVLLLTNVGQLHVWQDTTNKLTRCVFGLAHQILVTHVALTHDAVYFTTKLGEAYIGTISRKAPPTTPQQPIRKEREKDGKSSLVKFLEKDDCTSVRIVKIPNVHRAVSIAVDAEGLNFACLQTKPLCGLTSLPELSPSSMCKQMDTMRETAADDDLLHDVVFQVGNRLFPAHIFIIASSSDHLYKLYQSTITGPGDKPIIQLDNVHPEAFERVLKYMYCGTCDVTQTGACALKLKKEDLIGAKKDADSVLDEIENPSEVSAFEVYNARRRSQPPRARPYLDPVKLVQATAKRLHVKTLHKHLDNFYYRDGSIYLKDSADPTNEGIQWDRESFSELVDTQVCSKEGKLIPAHKCVLAARLDYFNGMFMHSWTESKLLSKVTLPINYNVLQPIINFLYTDKCPEVQNCDSIDYICNILIVADQLFISRLKEMCEISLANLITLKNCAELCQFAHTYNAMQLKQCCMEFISLNLCTILENRCLEQVEKTLLNDITNYYCKFNPIMSSRVITPFYNAPDDSFIEEFENFYPVDLSIVDEDVKRDEIMDVPKKKSKNKKIEYTESEKERMRYESVSLDKSMDVSSDLSGDIMLSLRKIKDEKGAKDKQEKWIEVPSQKQSKVVQARLKAISNAKDILNETPVESFTKLTRNSSAVSINSPLTRNSSAVSINSPENANTSRMSVSPKESPISEMLRSPQGSLVISHIGPKLSQKQRKKLALQGELSPTNLNEHFSKLNVGSPDKPKNPWKINEMPVASSSPKVQTGFNQILNAQKKQKEDSSRIMTKPLALTQLEDRAIEQLERFYNVNEIDDELITVRRIELQVYSPQWIHTTPK